MSKRMGAVCFSSGLLRIELAEIVRGILARVSPKYIIESFFVRDLLDDLVDVLTGLGKILVLE